MLVVRIFIPSSQWWHTVNTEKVQKRQGKHVGLGIKTFLSILHLKITTPVGAAVRT